MREMTPERDKSRLGLTTKATVLSGMSFSLRDFIEFLIQGQGKVCKFSKPLPEIGVGIFNILQVFLGNTFDESFELMGIERSIGIEAQDEIGALPEQFVDEGEGAIEVGNFYLERGDALFLNFRNLGNKQTIYGNIKTRGQVKIGEKLLSIASQQETFQGKEQLARKVLLWQYSKQGHFPLGQRGKRHVFKLIENFGQYLLTVMGTERVNGWDCGDFGNCGSLAISVSGQIVSLFDFEGVGGQLDWSRHRQGVGDKREVSEFHRDRAIKRERQ